jgi:hypothetical protein
MAKVAEDQEETISLCRDSLLLAIAASFWLLASSLWLIRYEPLAFGCSLFDARP